GFLAGGRKSLSIHISTGLYRKPNRGVLEGTRLPPVLRLPRTSSRACRDRILKKFRCQGFPTYPSTPEKIGWYAAGSFSPIRPAFSTGSTLFPADRIPLIQSSLRVAAFSLHAQSYCRRFAGPYSRGQVKPRS